MVDYSDATWTPSPNFDSGRNDESIIGWVLHDTASEKSGGNETNAYDSALSWLTNPESRVSSHYLCAYDGSRVDQLVREADTAWAAGNLEYNRRFIQIECVRDPSLGWSRSLYDRVARIIADGAIRHAVGISRASVIGHYEVPDPNNPALFGGEDHHTDPGNDYDFDYVIRAALALVGPDELLRFPGVAGITSGIGGGFRAYWESQGGLAIFGYPLNDEYRNSEGIVCQDFQRARFERRTGLGLPFDVQLGLVNAELLALKAGQQ